MYPEQPQTPVTPEVPTTPEPVVEQAPAAYPPAVEIEPPIVQQPPVAPEQPYQQPAAPQQPNQPAVTQSNPGKTLAIVGFIFAFVALQLVGLPLSIVALVKSRKAGFKNPLAVAGIILNVVFLLIGIGIIAAIAMVATQGVQTRAKSYAAETTAMAVMKQAEAAYVNQGSYPQHTAAIQGVTSVVYASAPLAGAPSNPNTIAFYACGDTTGNKIDYWDYSTSRALTMYTGSASETSTCTLAVN
jgi:type II secretory pathway pseudopilin PulG